MGNARSGQSLIEVLVGAALGALLVAAGAALIAPALRTNTRVAQIQAETQLGQELMDNMRSWASGNWNNVLALSTGTANLYTLNTAKSPFTATSSNTSTVSSAGLVGYWPLDEGAGSSTADGSGNGNNGTWSGTPTGTSGYYSPGQVGPWAGAFNGTNNLILLAATPTTGTGNFSIFCWVKTSVSGTRKGAVAYGATSTNNGTNLFINTGNTAEFDLSSVVGPSSTATVTDGNWHLIGVTNTGGTMQVYVDGAASGSSKAMSPNILTGSSNRIGEDFAPAYLNGLIDDVRVYSRALSTTEIQLLYAAGLAGLGGLSPGPSSEAVSGTSYTRYFYLSDVYRDSNGNVTTTISGNSYDPSTKQVTVVVNAVSSTANPAVFTMYLSRNGSNFISQSDWSGGSGQNNPITFISNVFATSTNVVTASSGQITLATQSSGGVCNASQYYDANIVSRWKFDEGSGSTVSDSVGGNTGTWGGTAVGGVHYTTGKVGSYAGTFNGSNDYIETPNLTTINSSAQPFSMSLWFNASSSGVLVDEDGQVTPNSGNWHASWMEVLSSGNIDVRVWNCSALLAGTASFNTWNHVAMTYDGTTLRSYLNGAAGASESCTRSVPSGSGYPEYIALGPNDSTNMGSGAWYNGAIDEFRIYNSALSSSSIASIYSGSPPSSGLLAYWNFEEGGGSLTAIDQSGSGNNGGWVGNPISNATYYVGGKVGTYAGYFNGTNDEVTVPNNANLCPSTFTVSAWFDANSFTADEGIVAKPINGPPWTSPYLTYLIRIDASNQIGFYVGNGSTYSSFDYTSTFVPGNWYYVDLTYNGSVFDGYLNGTLVGSSTAITGSLDCVSDPLIIGADYSASPFDYYFNGAIDDVRVYNTALSASIINTLYNNPTY